METCSCCIDFLLTRKHCLQTFIVVSCAWKHAAGFLLTRKHCRLLWYPVHGNMQLLYRFPSHKETLCTFGYCGILCMETCSCCIDFLLTRKHCVHTVIVVSCAWKHALAVKISLPGHLHDVTIKHWLYTSCVTAVCSYLVCIYTFTCAWKHAVGFLLTRKHCVHQVTFAQKSRCKNKVPPAL